MEYKLTSYPLAIWLELCIASDSGSIGRISWKDHVDRFTGNGFVVNYLGLFQEEDKAKKHLLRLLELLWVGGFHRTKWIVIAPRSLKSFEGTNKQMEFVVLMSFGRIDCILGVQ